MKDVSFSPPHRWAHWHSETAFDLSKAEVAGLGLSSGHSKFNVLPLVTSQIFAAPCNKSPSCDWVSPPVSIFRE